MENRDRKVEMTRLGLARPEQRWAIGTLLGLVQVWGSILIYRVCENICATKHLEIVIRK